MMQFTGVGFPPFQNDEFNLMYVDSETSLGSVVVNHFYGSKAQQLKSKQEI